jgi:hypothetical protein
MMHKFIPIITLIVKKFNRKKYQLEHIIGFLYILSLSEKQIRALDLITVQKLYAEMGLFMCKLYTIIPKVNRKQYYELKKFGNYMSNKLHNFSIIYVKMMLENNDED